LVGSNELRINSSDDGYYVLQLTRTVRT
jgi:hypothetical protein